MVSITAVGCPASVKAVSPYFICQFWSHGSSWKSSEIIHIYFRTNWRPELQTQEPLGLLNARCRMGSHWLAGHTSLQEMTCVTVSHVHYVTVIAVPPPSTKRPPSLSVHHLRIMGLGRIPVQPNDHPVYFQSVQPQGLYTVQYCQVDHSRGFQKGLTPGVLDLVW